MFTRKTALRLIADEKNAILIADFDRLAKIEPDKTRLVQNITAFAQDDLRIIAQRLQENQLLLEQAKAGIASAQNRITELQKAMTHLTIYAADGTANAISATNATTTRKA